MLVFAGIQKPNCSFHKKSGVYPIYPGDSSDSAPIRVYCNLTEDGTANKASNQTANVTPWVVSASFAAGSIQFVLLVPSFAYDMHCWLVMPQLISLILYVLWPNDPATYVKIW